MTKPPVIAIVGPTASGKTSLAIELAKKYGGEIISADSRQVYRGLDIGTGKVTPKEMAGIPHHLLDVADPSEAYTAIDFKRDATAAIESIIMRKKLPIIAGGTFFYLDLLRGKNNSAPVPPNQKLRQELEKLSTTELFEKLQASDPKRADSIDPQNKRRLIRSLEIVDTLGSVPPVQGAESPYDWLIIGTDVQKEDLRDKFQKRIKQWLQNGFAAEVEKVHKNLSAERFAELGFEYTLMKERLDQNIDEEELIERFVQKNWQYAKRQLTWLKRDNEVVWVKPEDDMKTEQVIDSFLDKG